MNDTEKAPPGPSVDGWAILELMGHRRLGGLLTEVPGGALAGFIRIDVPGDGAEMVATQFYAPAAVYCITPTTEALARAVAAKARPEPVQRWELPAVPDPARAGAIDIEDEDRS
jgi:hypothetical protein